ncbi:hypothetical protein NQZ68_002667 [Dissostichus eleginoides]|nr:hypothetical protein NQZ68_002667 [Dissostichus eleginoides]
MRSAAEQLCRERVTLEETPRKSSCSRQHGAVWNNLLTFYLHYKQPAHSAIPSTLMSAEFLEQI